MERYIEVMKHALKLAETMGEGLEHVNKRAVEGRFMETAPLFEDVLESFYNIETALQPVIPELEDCRLDEKSTALREEFEKLVRVYEQGEEAAAGEILNEGIMPRFREWKEEMERCFKDYLSS